ncbi:MAG: hypothetical protein F8N36_13735 [Desulfovibrio sp.]|uniref:hypothetical protein n=1 Tax=Desulfovibrio sp. TaxID=885 RepID=UPI00135EE536|nr:hypothetical protein [Desulfovibrio sp.]MTJ93900.1 hypothetical protein [Desulfovibrio sp.]
MHTKTASQMTETEWRAWQADILTDRATTLRNQAKTLLDQAADCEAHANDLRAQNAAGTS